MEIDWKATFKILNEEGKAFDTDFTSSKYKKHKVHLLIEELPTIEKRKQSVLEICKNWKCPSCNKEEKHSTIYGIVKNMKEKWANVLLIQKYIYKILKWYINKWKWNPYD